MIHFLRNIIDRRGSSRAAARRVTLMCVLALVLTMLTPSMIPVAEEDISVTGQTGTITVTLTVGGSPIQNAWLALYKVGSMVGSGQFVVDPDLSSANVDLATLTTSDAVLAAAYRLLGAAHADEELSFESGTTDESGVYVFSDLEPGIYVIAIDDSEEEGFTVGGVEHTDPADLQMLPALVTLPGISDGNYNISVAPKAQVDDRRGSLTVTKELHYDSMAAQMGMIELMAVDDVFYVGLYRDPDGLVPACADYLHEIHIQEDTVGTTTYDNLAPGSYYLLEVVNGSPIPANDNNGTFTNFITVNDQVTNTVTMDFSNSVTELGAFVDNIFYTLPEGYFISGFIRIQKKVVQGEEELSADDVEDTFYASLYQVDQATGEETFFKTVELDLSKPVEVKVPLLGDGDNPIQTFYRVVEVTPNEDGTYSPVDEGFDYTVETPEGQIVDLIYNASNKSDFDKSVTITNRIPTETPTPTPSPTPTPPVTRPVITATPTPTPVVTRPYVSITPRPNVTNPPGGSTNTGSTSTVSTNSSNTSTSVTHSENSSTTTTIKTGDDTPIALYIILLAVAAAAACITVIIRKKKG